MFLVAVNFGRRDNANGYVDFDVFVVIVIVVTHDCVQMDGTASEVFLLQVLALILIVGRRVLLAQVEIALHEVTCGVILLLFAGSTCVFAEIAAVTVGAEYVVRINDTTVSSTT